MLLCTVVVVARGGGSLGRRDAHRPGCYILTAERTGGPAPLVRSRYCVRVYLWVSACVLFDFSRYRFRALRIPVCPHYYYIILLSICLLYYYVYRVTSMHRNIVIIIIIVNIRLWWWRRRRRRRSRGVLFGYGDKACETNHPFLVCRVFYKLPMRILNYHV